MQDDISVCNHINLVPSAKLSVNKQLIVELLRHCANHKGKKQQLSQGDMATVLNISWEMVNNSLIDLTEQGAIRINRNKILINEQFIKKTYEQ
jgi:Mn-dependent DtxR family transcriptional regulator